MLHNSDIILHGSVWEDEVDSFVIFKGIYFLGWYSLYFICYKIFEK
jgi:hypothetical protein